MDSHITVSLLNILYIVVSISVALGSIAYTWGQFQKGKQRKEETDNNKIITSQKELIDTYEKKFDVLEEKINEQKRNHDTEIETFRKQHIESTKAIADLQGQIKVYKELPLQELAAGIKSLSEQNGEIHRILTEAISGRSKKS